jgi:predicted ABC-type transport system involved in lysophospholipase L1 biosynthesis ATPase subunit
MTAADPPLVEVVDVVKHHGSPTRLRLRHLAVRATDRLVLSGLDAGAAEVLIHLITGASVPDEGIVRVLGRDTRDIATDTEWLASLDRFGIVTARAVLIGALPIAANLALPLTLSIDPMSEATRAEVEALADRVGLARARLGDPASTLTPAELVRVHMARALAPKPQLLVLEQPTASIADGAIRQALGRALHDSASATGTGWLALTDDWVFGRASRSTRLTVRPTSGEIVGDSVWRRLMG